MRVLGIDPGADGAFALYSPAVAGVLDRGQGVPGTPEFVQVWDMPINKVMVGGSERKRLDPLGVLELLDEICLCGNPDRIVIEEVAAMPKQSGMFAFGFGVGAVHMALTARGLVFEKVTPATWKRAIKAPKDKAQAIVRAEELLPKWRHLWRDTTKTAAGKARPDRAEAALIAYYGATCR